MDQYHSRAYLYRPEYLFLLKKYASAHVFIFGDNVLFHGRRNSKHKISA